MVICKITPVHRRAVSLTILLLGWLGMFSSEAVSQTPPLPLVPCQTWADFCVEGQPPNLPWQAKLADPEKRGRLVLWGSWCGNSMRRGQLTLGPFKAPRHFSMAVCGKPAADGSVLKLVCPSLGAQLVITRDSPGNNWEQVDLDLPQQWVGADLQIVAFDNSTAPDGWLGLSEPYTVASDGSLHPLWRNRTLGLRWIYWLRDFAVPLCLILLVYSIVGISGFSILRRFLNVESYLSPLLIAAIVALSGYVVFCAFWIGPHVGRVAAWGMIVVSAGFFFRSFRNMDAPLLPRADWLEMKWPVLLMLVALLFDLGVMCFTRVEATPFYVLAARRATAWPLPEDNILQQQVAKALYDGLDPRTADSREWQTSDRPPLQCGVQLLSAVFVHGLFRCSFDVNAQLSGVVFQLIWIYGAWALLRASGCSTTAACQVLICLIPTPFAYIHSIFVWAKLTAAAFSIGTIVVLGLGIKRPLDFRHAALAGVLLSLGMLAHSGTIFFLIPAMGLWFLFPSRDAATPGWRPILVMICAASLLMLPWIAYQKIFDPPGDHLLKLHLAGAIDYKPISTLKSIRLAYQAVSGSTIRANKLANFAALFKGDWTTLFSLFPSNLIARRTDNFFYVFRSTGLFGLGFLAVPVLLFRGRSSQLRPHFFLLSAVALSLVMWCLIMFTAGSTVVHQGAFATQLVLLVVLAWLLQMLHPVALLIVGVCNGVQFLWIYLNPHPYPLRLDPIALVVLICALLLGVVVLVTSSKSTRSTGRIQPIMLRAIDGQTQLFNCDP